MENTFSLPPRAPSLSVRLYLNAVCILLQDCHVKWIFSKCYKCSFKVQVLSIYLRSSIIRWTADNYSRRRIYTSITDIYQYSSVKQDSKIAHLYHIKSLIIRKKKVWFSSIHISSLKTYVLLFSSSWSPQQDFTFSAYSPSFNIPIFFLFCQTWNWRMCLFGGRWVLPNASLFWEASLIPSGAWIPTSLQRAALCFDTFFGPLLGTHQSSASEVAW